ncbi:iron ABC transporter permease [Terrarubrum flagellatum]|uniref:ABC transporter permease n=1 Tax=Terrirubrum flagellatum TaxID=2895980 RepID=UPI00314524E9
MTSIASGESKRRTASAPAITQERLIQLGLLAILAALLVGPLAILIRAGFAPPNTLPFESWSITTANFRAIILDPTTPGLLANTLIYAAGSMGLGVAIATALAWLTERTDMPGRALIRTALFTWMAVPPVIIGFGWILLINPGNGALNAFARWAFGASAPFTIYSMWALIFITALSVAPTAHVMISGLLQNMDPQLEQAGKVHGATSVQIARRITLPLLTPGILSIGVFMLVAVVQAFDLPVIVGLTARIPVLSTRIFLLSSPDTGVPNYGLAAAFGTLLLVAAALLMWLYFRIVGAGEKYRVVSGRAFRTRRIALGRWRLFASTGSLLLLLVMISPVLILLWTSFLPFYRLPSIDGLSQLTLSTYRRVLALPSASGAILNTVPLVTVSATIVMLLSSLIAWISVRARGALSRALETLSFLPAAVPPIVMAMAILLMYLRTPLYGALALLIIGHITIYIAFGTRTMSSALVQIHKELTDAALVSGASLFAVFRRIIVPLVWPQILNGFLWVVAHSARDLTIPLMLMTASNMVVASLAWTMWDIPDLPAAAALSMLLVAVLLVVVAPLQLVIARATDRRA